MKKITETTLKKIAAKCNMKLTYGKYRMWHHIPFIGKTAMVVDGIAYGGGYCLIPLKEISHKKINGQYILEAIRNEAISLGQIDFRKRYRPFTSWAEHVGEYPPGYFTHRVGNDIKEVA